MYAVVETGGKQIRLQAGDTVKVERITGEVGEAVELDDIRLIVDGDDVVAEKAALDASKVKAVIRGHGRGDKVYAFRFKKRKRIRTKRGHRQHYTELEVTEILTGGKSSKAAAGKAKAPRASASVAKTPRAKIGKAKTPRASKSKAKASKASAGKADKGSK